MDQENADLSSDKEPPLQELLKKDEVVASTDQLPEQLPLFPVTRRPFFPGMVIPIQILKKSKLYEVVKHISKIEEKYIAIVLTKNEEIDIDNFSIDDLYKVGVSGKILRLSAHDAERVQIVINVENRLTVVKEVLKCGCLFAQVAYYKNAIPPPDAQVKAYSVNIITTIKELIRFHPLFKEELQLFLNQSDFTSPDKLTDFSVTLTTSSREELQKILEERDFIKRMERALFLLRRELDLSKLQNNITHKIEASISKNQREFFLREQLNAIQKELGIVKEGQNCDEEKFLKRIQKRAVPEEVLHVIEEECDKLRVLDIHSSEYSICRNYLDWLTIIPWGVCSKENRSLQQAQKILDRDHYGLEDVKERILEFISVGILSGKMSGNILCFVGPPGVGKTSIAKSIAVALKRKFFRFSVGSMYDEAEIKGHRRTYLGSMPGKFIQALKKTGTREPVIVIDEIDKIGNSYRGDPSSALLEALDPEQNREFLDHYLDVPCDLSGVLFILTANVLDTIPDALRDRMEVLRLSGYTQEEKVAIARKYLIPKHRKKVGMQARQLSFPLQSIEYIIEKYARESGVRSLEKSIEKILRKLTKQLVEHREKKESFSKVLINSQKIESLLGSPRYTSDRFYQKTPAGVSTGLAWTSAGGATLYIEAVQFKSEKVQMKLTGQAGDVMKESAQIAWTYLQSLVSQYFVKKAFFPKSSVHIHIPEGATPKDGPSAGITLVSALFSLVMKQEIAPDIAMTGELTLTGKVLPVGGIKEKLMAARRSKLSKVILPFENKRDYEELPEHIRDLQTFFVSHYEEALPLLFPKCPLKSCEKKAE